MRPEVSVAYHQISRRGSHDAWTWLEAAQELGDIDAHGFDLHRLKGDRQGEWAISVSGNWRITFRFAKGEALDINLEGYH